MNTTNMTYEEMKKVDMSKLTLEERVMLRRAMQPFRSAEIRALRESTEALVSAYKRLLSDLEVVNADIEMSEAKMSLIERGLDTKLMIN